jgi:DNA-binding helix-hairpin-helix protein with protein kinase domain
MLERNQKERWAEIIGEYPRYSQHIYLMGKRDVLDNEFVHILSKLNEHNRLDYYEQMDKETSHRAILAEIEEIKQKAKELDAEIVAKDAQVKKDREEAKQKTKEMLNSKEFIKLCKNQKEVAKFLRDLNQISRKGDLMLTKGNMISHLQRENILQSLFTTNKKYLKENLGITEIAGEPIDDIQVL